MYKLNLSIGDVATSVLLFIFLFLLIPVPRLSAFFNLHFAYCERKSNFSLHTDEITNAQPFSGAKKKRDTCDLIKS